ncbi:hypothetical protein [Aquimarina muelleri]|uniref:Natural product n=1 Tax=Aquimarina muelleri TaxID=279356 RepID=A0A918N474_9FLAO|nr:hypothetical protein [Aquimarina muelleri]MCX2764525.1 hypothetical protein [Aquimarina muelleri]GGX33137.1 hypothetical protein GCM10007384_37350 [Aquimarina muelleri]
MKNSNTQNKLGKLSLEKLKIAKLKNTNHIIGGNANNNKSDDLSLPTWTKPAAITIV